jgi:hypothetical protein
VPLIKTRYNADTLARARAAATMGRSPHRDGHAGGAARAEADGEGDAPGHEPARVKGVMRRRAAQDILVCTVLTRLEAQAARDINPPVGYNHG